MKTNGNVEASGEGLGPSYWDVDRYAEGLRDEFGIGVRFVVVPPLYVQTTGQRTSWKVAAQVWRLGNAETPELGATAAWGRGGSWKTAPQAMHAALRAVEEKLRERAAKAERQARL